ncbi:transposase [Streptomyces sp900116325]|uniref:transposase n=1 Tax=Streptomyces sp. 900116325 TaxID=3154295 RepID=UPI00332E0A18
MPADADSVPDEVRAYAVDHLGSDGGVLIVDETGIMTKARSSAGVQRQYTGTTQRIENVRSLSSSPTQRAEGVH